jgi:recombination protein RecA
MGKNKKKIGVLLAEKDLRRRYPDSGLASNICLNEDRDLRLPCKVLSINYHLGGGIPYGKIIEIMGEESTGKSLLAMDFGTVAQSLGGVVLWDDAEASFDGTWAKKHGLTLEKIQLLPYENVIEIISDWIADMCIYWRSKLTKNEPILLVIDSIAVLEAKDAMDTAQVDTKAEMGRRSFKMGEMLRKRTKIFAKYGVCVLFINQIRKKIGASQFEDPDTTPMAQCMKYYASQRIGLYRGKRLKKGGAEKGPWVGNMVYLRTKKNKTSIPRDNVQAKVFFRKDGENFGYNKYFGFGELCVDRGIILRKSGRFYYRGEQVAHGEEALELKISEDAEFRKKLINKLKVNTPSALRQRLENEKVNLFPVKLKVSKNEEE